MDRGEDRWSGIGKWLRSRWWPWCLILVVQGAYLSGCASGGGAPVAPAPQPEAETGIEEAARLERLEPVPNQPLPGLGPRPVPDYFRGGLASETRSSDGRPGSRYWQQYVRYRIDAELDPGTGVVHGTGELVYLNNSPDTLGSMVFHLYQNLFSEGVERTRTVPVTGGVKLGRVAVSGQEAVAVEVGSGPASGASYRVSGTLMELRLPESLLPGDSLVVSMTWRFEVPPRGAPRTGRIDHSLYNVAQWYPQVAVYDDLRGWNRQPYLGNGEFYLEYGDFDVSLTLPEGWLVGATGVLMNPEEVLPVAVRRRLSLAMERDTVIHVVRSEDLGPGSATEQAPGGHLTWRFVARSVRDFAWGTSNRYLWDATRALVPDPDRPDSTKAVPVNVFYRPEIRSWRSAAEYTRHALTYHADRWHPYVYPQITALEGPVGGMEYPMVIFVGGFSDAESLYGTIDHEVAHQWFPMMVGNNETSFAWLDEGLATYIEELALSDFFPQYRAFALPLAQYLQIAGSDFETPMMRAANLYPSYASFAIATYFKPALMLRALEGIIGRDQVFESLREYTRRWFMRHPYPEDFFNTVESVSGRSLDWFWTPWWYGTGVFDQGIEGVGLESSSDGVVVEVRVDDHGAVPMPTLVVVTLEDGTVHRGEIPIERWLEGGRSQTLRMRVPGQVARVELDPDRLFPDVDRSNNVWQPAVVPASAGAKQ